MGWGGGGVDPQRGPRRDAEARRLAVGGGGGDVHEVVGGGAVHGAALALALSPLLAPVLAHGPGPGPGPGPAAAWSRRRRALAAERGGGGSESARARPLRGGRREAQAQRRARLLAGYARERGSAPRARCSRARRRRRSAPRGCGGGGGGGARGLGGGDELPQLAEAVRVPREGGRVGIAARVRAEPREGLVPGGSDAVGVQGQVVLRLDAAQRAQQVVAGLEELVQRPPRHARDAVAQDLFAKPPQRALRPGGCLVHGPRRRARRARRGGGRIKRVRGSGAGFGPADRRVVGLGGLEVEVRGSGGSWRGAYLEGAMVTETIPAKCTL